MTRDEFGFWLKGMMASGEALQAIVTAVLYKAAEMNEGTPRTRTPPPAWRALPLPQFCVHNVALAEACPACPVLEERVFAFSLPPALKQVYIEDHG